MRDVVETGELATDRVGHDLHRVGIAHPVTDDPDVATHLSADQPEPAAVDVAEYHVAADHAVVDGREVGSAEERCRRAIHAAATAGDDHIPADHLLLIDDGLRAERDQVATDVIIGGMRTADLVVALRGRRYPARNRRPGVFGKCGRRDRGPDRGRLHLATRRAPLRHPRSRRRRLRWCSIALADWIAQTSPPMRAGGTREGECRSGLHARAHRAFVRWSGGQEHSRATHSR
jgi:hypothetical protein